MGFLDRLADALAEVQWGIDNPEDQFRFDSPYRTEPLEFEGSRDAWITERGKVWRHRFDRIGKEMQVAETIASAFVLFFVLVVGHMHTWMFSHWWDLAAVPLLIGVDQVRAGLVKDAGSDPSAAIYVLSRIIFGFAGLAFGFLFPLLLSFGAIALLFILPLVARKTVTVFRYF